MYLVSRLDAVVLQVTCTKSYQVVITSAAEATNGLS